MSKGEIVNESIKKKRVFAIRLISGDVKLVVTYWVFGVLFSSILTLITITIEKYYVSLTLSDHSKFYDALISGFYYFFLAYTIFIFIAIWRSAGKYEGKSIWAASAKIAVFLGALSLVSGLYEAYRQSTEVEVALKEDVRILNQGLPVLINENTRLDSITLEHGNLYYNYTLINYTIYTIDVDSYTQSTASMMKTWACEDEDKREFLMLDRTMHFLYRDKEGKPVTKISVTIKDCFNN